ncbi:MAG: sugar-binding transcriptional regulator [Desulfobacterales bacterium]|nr:sugar-binding transcriptional regulator [Desulfobacterales bacterium]
MELDRLNIKVCRLFYEEQFTKTEIEKKLQISRFKVARILKDANRSGLVKIQINEPDADLSELERELEAKFDLNSAVLVWDDEESLERLKKKVGEVAASYLLGILKKGDVFGVGWGTTTYELVNALPDAVGKKVRVVQVSGGNTALSSGIDSQALTMQLAKKFGVEPYLLHAPTLVDRPETRDALMKESALQQIFKIYQNINMLIAGIGAFFPGGFIGTRHIDHSEMEMLPQEDVVGEFLTYCFDVKGNICQTETLNRIIAIPIDVIRKVPCSVAIAVGHEKAVGVIGAIRAGLINTLITDTTSAKTMLQNVN